MLEKRYINIYGRKIYHIALDNDYYLINNVKLASHDDKIASINHLLFGDKYIYLISDYYYRGEVSAKESDLSWIYRPLSKKEHARYIDNPILKNISLLELKWELSKSSFQ